MLTTGILGKLHRDHQAVMRLTTDINEQVDTGSGSYGRLFAELKQELRAHFAAEEAVLYGELDQHAEYKDDVRDGREEHEEIEEILADLERCDDEEEWLATFQELEEAIEHHVREVEGEVFAAASRALGKDRLQELAEAFTREKARRRAELTGRDDDEEEEVEEERASRDSLSA
jgi:hemerythrin